jgi:hypothetical protein
MPAGFPNLPSGFGAGFDASSGLPPGTQLPDLSKLKFPKS